MDAQPESQIVDAVLKAISEQRLRAGAKLGEQALSELFNCNRANVRRALASLAAKQVVELRPNRGAFVVTPSAQEARDVFQARRAIERTIARQAVRRVTDADITYLRDNIAAEAEARARRDKPTELRLSQQFHMYLARLSGNRVLERFLAELTMRSTLILGMYPSAEHSCAHCDEHDGIVDALMARDEELLLRLTDEHLRHLESGLNFDLPPVASGSLRDQLIGAAPLAAETTPGDPPA
ncbi:MULTISPECIES: GntR family transcriptional regulator [unclassified Paracoccus (in: a-proteobacteria)]|uniref:GntR family transcriptional regulator n=1 Tax=unclassified Paracoccus (in: a-proteobacteria) TaxID=2688777 RepID=UPI0012B41EF7|nr:MULTISPECIES: GntR family transcriptional regulator [unclassified Paracoccus (in: a-proteobacteria)]UXU76325.1 GntR family transcriptional regulator [Paracoccus sp. SMMA_5]UXU82337.1 GntR family transcriptional regulator [Paracoccus sp. SMMA_5_TC]